MSVAKPCCGVAPLYDAMRMVEPPPQCIFCPKCQKKVFGKNWGEAVAKWNNGEAA